MEIHTESGPLTTGGTTPPPAPVTVVAPPPAPIAPTPPAAPPALAVAIHLSHKKLYLIIGGLLILFAAGAAGGYYWWSHRPYTDAQIIALIRQNIIPSVVQVRCTSVDGGTETQWGTGVYYTDPNDGSPLVATNAHVVLGDDGQYHGCNIYFPRAVDGSFYDSEYPAGQPVLYNTLEAKIGSSTVEGLDYATLPLMQDASSTYPWPPVQQSTSDAIAKICNRSRTLGNTINLGDKLYIIGYPATGDSSVTLTEGIVSGYDGDYNEFIKTSAAVNHGNSGGIAIGEASGCDYGIPSAATFEAGSNLGYVLSNSFIGTFLNSLTGSTTYAVPDLSAPHADSSPHLTQTYDDPSFGFTMDVPDSWTVTKSVPQSDGSIVTMFAAPSEGALDTFNENLTIYQYATSTTADYSYAVSQVDTLAQTLDPQNSVSKDVTLDGVHTHQVIFVDSSLQNFSESVEGYYIIFRYKGELYEIVSQTPFTVDGYNYLLLFARMGDSIKFR